GTGANQVVKVRASDGAVVGSVSLPHPNKIAYDGTNIWVTSESNTTNGVVAVIRPSDGVVLSTVTLVSPPSANNDLEGIVFDGDSMWVADNGVNKLYKIRALDGVVVGTY